MLVRTNLQNPLGFFENPAKAKKAVNVTVNDNDKEKKTSKKKKASKSSKKTADIDEIFQHWKDVLGHQRAKLDDKRRRIIRKAMECGYTKDEIMQAITGCSLTPHNMGHNDRGQRYDGLGIILRDADNIDRFIRNAKNPPPMPRTPGGQGEVKYTSTPDSEISDILK